MKKKIKTLFLITYKHFSEASEGRTFSFNEDRWQVVVTRNMKVISLRQRSLSG
jgi:hypothetical protein